MNYSFIICINSCFIGEILLNILELSKDMDKYRRSCINFIASENILSDNAKAALTLQHSRYHATFYGGSNKFINILDQTTNLAKDVFNANNAWVTPISGNLTDLAVIFSFTKATEKIAMLPLSPGGGYPINLDYFNRKRVDIPFSIENYNIDLDKTNDILSSEKPELVILGSSLILFPQPVKEVSEIVHDYGGTVVYDGSHVLGLIAGGEFQQPLEEGVDVLIGSTHKSFPGPQGGVILSNNFGEKEFNKVIGKDPLEGIVLVDNIHNSRIQSLGVVLEEMKKNGKIYAQKIIQNSKGLAKGLNSVNVKLHGVNNNFTNSHQVLVDIPDFSYGEKQRNKLLDYNIVTDSALRFGTSEVTRLGYNVENLSQIGEIIGEILLSYLTPDRSSEIQKSITKFVIEHKEIVI